MYEFLAAIAGNFTNSFWEFVVAVVFGTLGVFAYKRANKISETSMNNELQNAEIKIFREYFQGVKSLKFNKYDPFSKDDIEKYQYLEQLEKSMLFFSGAAALAKFWDMNDVVETIEKDIMKIAQHRVDVSNINSGVQDYCSDNERYQRSNSINEVLNDYKSDKILKLVKGRLVKNDL